MIHFSKIFVKKFGNNWTDSVVSEETETSETPATVQVEPPTQTTSLFSSFGKSEPEKAPSFSFKPKDTPEPIKEPEKSPSFSFLPKTEESIAATSAPKFSFNPSAETGPPKFSFGKKEETPAEDSKPAASFFSNLDSADSGT